MTRTTSFALACVVALAGCGGGGTATQPAVTTIDPIASNVIQLAVGVATISTSNGASVAHGLNVVETLRQPNGLSGVLYDVPALTGPSTFQIATNSITSTPIDAGHAGSDLRTNRISQATLDVIGNVTFFNGPLAIGRPQTFPTAGAFGYGLCDCNANSGPVIGVAPLYVAYGLPIYGGQQQFFYGGPPAFPSASPELVQQGFTGYSLGFTDFAVAPVLGAYRLDAAIPPSFDNPVTSSTPTLSATSQITSLVGLPAFPTPSFVADALGGGAVSVTVPPGAVEAMVFVQVDPIGASPTVDACNAAHSTTQFFSIRVAAGGAQTVSLPDTLGAPDAQGRPTRSICSGQPYKVYAAAFDYPAYESAYPQNLSQTPPITSPSGQADVSTSDSQSGNYP